MKFSTAALFLGLAASANAQIPTPNYPQIAGYFARTDATAFLNRDLDQQALEDSTTGIGDESCESFDANAQTLYDAGNWASIPTYTDSESDSYNEYSKFYGKDDWVDIWASKAIKKTRTNYKRGNADFGKAFPNAPGSDGGCVGFEEVLKKGLAYTAQVAEMLQLGQKARDEAAGGCQFKRTGCELAIKAWDGAAAVYVGSLEGADGDNDPVGNYGKAPYALADKRCRNYKNCGPDLNEDTKDVTSNINTKILSLFSAGSLAAWEGDYNQLDKIIRLISNKAAVPLIQGTFRYYWRLSDEEGANTFSVLDKEVGEGGAFIFGVLPKLWACSSRGSKRAENQSKIGGEFAGISAVNFQDIKLAFECNYRCLGITCEEVGTLYDGDENPKPGTEACDDAANGSDTTCAKPDKDTKNKCKLYTGKPGVKSRDKLRFSF
eukprot:CAMPEP_0197172942 /NCGR_PEP_ID=MMETSP1423-20130617/17_1 /TAXON_ID=476441 /ORGANISM="Pseudo-nitzschia heimii, Strain UNC1101" /LENGTH=434 /DNA_ID=CAMNT_0042621665 /DNA_START=60 /DNA_END=1364 /DNA_ORIENTATION=-